MNLYVSSGMSSKSAIQASIWIGVFPGRFSDLKRKEENLLYFYKHTAPHLIIDQIFHSLFPSCTRVQRYDQEAIQVQGEVDVIIEMIEKISSLEEKELKKNAFDLWLKQSHQVVLSCIELKNLTDLVMDFLRVPRFFNLDDLSGVGLVLGDHRLVENFFPLLFT